MKFGLRNIRELLRSAGNPEKLFPSMHVAGTNGKGSTASFLASIAMEAGYKTGLYTSPHLVRFTERIRVNGTEITEHDLVDYVRVLRPTIEKLRVTFFEATTCIAFLHFADAKVDLAIVEAGLGGRLDATNVLSPLASVITNVDREHIQYLGRTIPAIAREKGGIIKRGIPCVTGSTDPDVLRTLAVIAARKKAPFYAAKKIVRADFGRAGGNDVRLNLTSKRFRLRNVVLGLPGAHQALNAQLAVAAIDVLLRKAARRFRRIDGRAISRGLRRVRENTGLRGRFETLRKGKRYILDVGHNPAGIRTLVSSIRRQSLEPLVVVFGVMKDKEYIPMIRELKAIAKQVVPVSARNRRGLRAGLLYAALRRQHIPAIRGGSVHQGMRAAYTLCGRAEPILITGSHYVVGEALEYLKEKKT
jgi:dihydrofolate synthase/folylpolyglutamate synthase